MKQVLFGLLLLTIGWSKDKTELAKAIVIKKVTWTPGSCSIGRPGKSDSVVTYKIFTVKFLKSKQGYETEMMAIVSDSMFNCHKEGDTIMVHRQKSIKEKS